MIIIDGDVIVNPHYFKKILEYPKECVAFSYIKSEEPIYLNIINKKVVHFSLKKTKYIHPVIIKIKKKILIVVVIIYMRLLKKVYQ